MNRGFIKIYRRAFSNKLWTKARVFSEFEAWLDLLQSARFAETDTTEYIGARLVTYGRGQRPASQSYLAVRWGWGTSKVRSFLSGLVKDNSITLDHRQGVNVVTICNYDRYNAVDQAENQANSQAKDQVIDQTVKELYGCKTKRITKQTAKRQPGADHNKKKEKKEKKEKEESVVQTKVFTPPTLLEVEKYCRQRNNTVDAQRFVDFYQCKGWMVGRNKMQDWRAAVRRWETQLNNSVSASKPNIAKHDNKASYEQF